MYLVDRRTAKASSATLLLSETMGVAGQVVDLLVAAVVLRRDEGVGISSHHVKVLSASEGA